MSVMIASAVITLPGTGVVVAGKPAPTPALYTITDLGGFGAFTSVQSVAQAVSNLKSDGKLTVVGEAYTTIAYVSHPAVWTMTPAGSIVSVADLGAPSTATSTWATAVNDHGVSTYNVYAGPPFSGFVSIPGVGSFPLPTFGGANAAGNGINNSGDIVGYADTANSTRQGALWNIDQAGNFTGTKNLETFIPNDINEAGVMCGTQNGVATIGWIDDMGNLQTQPLGLLSTEHIGSRAFSINNLREVVGASNAPDSTGGVSPQAFLWRAGTMTALGNLGGIEGSATSINDSSQIVGASSDRQGSTVPFLWRNGTISNLNTLAGLSAGNKLVTATGINNSGHIVGLGSVATSKKITELHGYILTPKP